MHLLTAGTDAAVLAFRIVQGVVVAAVVAFTILRVVATRRRSAGSLPVEEPVHVDQVDAGKG